MKCVYLLESRSHSDQRYVGITGDIHARVKLHNAGRVPHTAKYLPWKLVVAAYFADDERAQAFERYLKSGSGRAFAGRHLW